MNKKELFKFLEQNTKPLQFEYCECGCHGFFCSIGKIYFWHGDADKDGNYNISNTHSYFTSVIFTGNHKQIQKFVRSEQIDYLSQYFTVD